MWGTQRMNARTQRARTHRVVVKVSFRRAVTHAAAVEAVYASVHDNEALAVVGDRDEPWASTPGRMRVARRQKRIG